MGFDLVVQDETGAGVAGAGGGELVAERGEGRGAVSGSMRMSSSPLPAQMSPETVRASRISV